MKILHIGKYYPPYFGGIEKVNFDLVEGLNEAGTETDVICFNDKTKGSRPEINNYKVFRSNIIFTLLGQPISLDYVINLKKIIKDYSIIHLHLPNPFAAIFVLLFITDQNLILHWHNDIIKQQMFLFFYKPILYRILKRSNIIIGTSQEYINFSPFLTNYKHKCRVVPIGVIKKDIQENRDFTKILRKRYNNKKVILSVGRLSKYKGYKYLIKSASYLDENMIIIIIGKGEEENNLKEIIKSSNLDNKVYLIKDLPYEKLGSYYSLCSLFCMSSISRNEGFGIVQLEAMLYGKPIVTTDITGSGISYGNIHRKTGLVVPIKNELLLADSIKEILNGDNVDFFQRNSISRVKNIFSKQNMINKMLNIYKGL